MTSGQSVFISYRATNFSTALAVYQGLAQHGFDVFMRFQEGKELGEVSAAEIKRRGHFVAIISPSALEAYQDESGPLRKEVELALESGRNVIPLVMEGFDSSSPSVQKAISGKLEKLKDFGALRLYSEYFFAGMEKLRERCLNNPLEMESQPALSAALVKVSTEEKDAAASAPPVQMKELITDGESGISQSLSTPEALARLGVKLHTRARDQHARYIERRGALLKDTLHKLTT